MNTRKSAAAHGLHNRALAECALLALFTTLTLGSNTAAAATYASVQIDGIDGGLVNKSSTLANDTVALGGTGTGVRGGTTSASAAASATEGLIIVDTSAASTAISHINSTTSANAYATARWSDVITIDAGALNGNFGYVNALIDVSGGIGGMASPVPTTARAATRTCGFPFTAQATVPVPIQRSFRPPRPARPEIPAPAPSIRSPI